MKTDIKVDNENETSEADQDSVESEKKQRSRKLSCSKKYDLNCSRQEPNKDH